MGIQKRDKIIIVLLIAFLSSLGVNIYTMNRGDKPVKEEPAEVPKEIERKWLVNEMDIPYDLTKGDIFEVEQSYISFDPEIRIRGINNGEFFILTIKANMSVDGLVRDEIEYYITEETYKLLLSKKEGNTILKTRYQVVDETGVKRSIDIFQGNLKGLVYVETEYKSEEDANKDVMPNWVIQDVTSNKQYKNQSLARNGMPDEL